MLYAIQAEGTAYVKIGVTSGETVKVRLEKLQTGSPHLLVVLASAAWPDRYERLIHHELREHRVRGEWFTLAPAVIAVVDMLKDKRYGLGRYCKQFNAPIGFSQKRRLGRALAYCAAQERERSGDSTLTNAPSD